MLNLYYVMKIINAVSGSKQNKKMDIFDSDLVW